MGRTPFSPVYLVQRKTSTKSIWILHIFHACEDLEILPRGLDFDPWPVRRHTLTENWLFYNLNLVSWEKFWVYWMLLSNLIKQNNNLFYHLFQICAGTNCKWQWIWSSLQVLSCRALYPLEDMVWQRNMIWDVGLLQIRNPSINVWFTFD